jgi:hypothetical protein
MATETATSHTSAEISPQKCGDAMNTTAFSDFDSWKEHGIKLAQIHSDHQFEIARWMLTGEKTFGDRNPYDAAEAITGYARLTLQNWVYVARHCSMRIESLSFNHHQIVAALEPEQQKEWLERAATEKWSVKKLAAAIQEARSASVELDGPATPEATAAATPRSRKQGTPGELYKALWFVPLAESHKLDLLALARGISVEELIKEPIIHAIEQLNIAAVDEIERQREILADARKAWNRKESERCRLKKIQEEKPAEAEPAESETEKPIVETAQPDAPAATPQNKPAPALLADTAAFDLGAMMLVESRLKEGLPVTPELMQEYNRWKQTREIEAPVIL